MRFLLSLLCIPFFLSGCEKELKSVERQLIESRKELEQLGEPVLSQTTPEVGYMTLPKFSNTGAPTPLGSKWVRLDLGVDRRITQVALIAARLDWERLLHPAYNFPRRFKVELSRDADFEQSECIGDFTGADFPNPGINPVVIQSGEKTARYVRLTVTSRDAFALAEIMVLDGRRNVAIGTNVDAAVTVDMPPRWGMKYLVDGRTPLGIPILDEPRLYDGIFAGPPETDQPVYMELDLKAETPIEELRIYPVHGRNGIDLPGYRFPQEFEIQVADEPDFKSPRTIFFTAGPYPNPGNNVVTIPVHDARGRYIRILLLSGEAPLETRRFGLSELEVYSNGTNVARGAEVITSPSDRGGTRKGWPKSILVDGYSSFGRIIELPEWLQNWTRRRELNDRIAELNKLQLELLEQSGRRKSASTGAMIMLLVVGVPLIVFYLVKIRRQEIERFRRELAHDLHDEIGSNLAAINILSEAAAVVSPAPGSDYCKRINLISVETTAAMRETLWLAGFKEKIGSDLMVQMQTTAARILTGLKVEWTSIVEQFPEGQEDPRHIFLFFKESLANIVRHSQADTVTLSARIENGFFVLEIRDNGKGFDVKSWSGGTGLQSLQSRAARMGGTIQVETAPQNGTRVILRTRLKKKARGASA